MINVGVYICPKCGGRLRYYDKVKRIVKGKNGDRKYVYISRKVCIGCKSVHREIPNDILPYCHYERDIVYGVVNGFIFSNVIGFEDYPCELTMSRWKTKFLPEGKFQNNVAKNTYLLIE